MTRAELICALENAEGPSRELDAEIWATTLPRIGTGIDGYDLPTGAHYEYEAWDDGKVNMYVHLKNGDVHRRAARFAPHLTSSLDAALSLVPEGWAPSLIAWSVECLVKPTERVRASLFRHDTDKWPNGGYVSSDGATPALALTAACLKALETTPTQAPDTKK